MINLKREREKKNISQDELARLIDVQRQSISAIERGITKPTVENAKKIAEVLGLDWTKFYDKDTESNIS